MSSSSRRYRVVTAEIREAAVKQMLAIMGEHPGLSRTAAAKTVARNLGVHHNSVLNWLADAEDLPTEGIPKVADLAAQNALLRQRLATAEALNQSLTSRLHNLAPEAG
ncbi:transposase [Nocardia sp. NPDC050435]|uniref:transposase n=1 Tax=Nocardia sp. NPDC050435 TaxID=3155040 RepID=UPI00340BAB80